MPIQTYKVLNNSYNQGGSPQAFSSTIQIDPVVSDQFDEASTENIVLLRERKDTAQKIYNIFISSDFYNKYCDTSKKIEKNDISKIFYYTKEHLSEVKQLTAFEMLIAINEFYDFNYNLIWDSILTMELKSAILQDVNDNIGMKKKMQTSLKLF